MSILLIVFAFVVGFALFPLVVWSAVQKSPWAALALFVGLLIGGVASMFLRSWVAREIAAGRLEVI
jgi:hypothetical protein